MLATGLSKTVLKSGSVGKLVVTTVLHFNMQTIYSETRGTPHDLNWNNASKHPTSTFDLNGQARAWSRGKKKRWAVVRYSQGFGAAVLGEFDECDAAVW